MNSERKLRSTGTGGANPAVTAVPTAPMVWGVKEIANALGVPASSIYEWCRYRATNRGTAVIPHRRLGKYLKFFPQEVQSWALGLPQDVKTKKRAYRRREKT